MSKLIQRFLIFFIGLPMIAAIAYLLPYRNHLALNIVAVLFSVLGALELAAMLKTKNLVVTRINTIILGAAIPLLSALTVCFNISPWIIPSGIAAVLALYLILPVFSRNFDFSNYIHYIAAGIMVLVYPGFFISWICAMGRMDGRLLLLFLLIPIAVDSSAWAVGMVLGKNNRGILKISPNKSIAGFIGGLLAAALIGFAAVSLLPGLFDRGQYALIVRGILLGLLPGIAATLGDLCESGIKRSCGFKDSGTIILGRGGALDSIDSIALAAPVFYITLKLLFPHL